MRLKNILLASLVAGVALLSGCAGMQPARFVSNVDSLAQADAVAKKRYVLLPGGKGVEAGDLQFQEFAAYVEKVLSEKGFVKAATFQDADVVIFLAYAIGESLSGILCVRHTMATERSLHVSHQEGQDRLDRGRRTHPV